MKWIELDSKEGLAALRKALVAQGNRQAFDIRQAVEKILRMVQERGDDACAEYTRKFDGVALAPQQFELSAQERRELAARAPRKLQQALKQAAGNIRDFHRRQLPQHWQVQREGIRLMERAVPVQRVGVYIPGGRAKYPSTVLMTAIPARLAGAEEIIMVSPPDRKTGTVDAAEIAGVDRIFRIGGAQAVAALAFGTATIPAVDKIVGPGNAYVAEAKRQVFGEVGIDMFAGPTELGILFDDSAPLEWIAQDLFAQMEHDPATRSLIVAKESSLLRKLQSVVESRMEELPRSEILQQSWRENALLVHAGSADLAADAINLFAPEHLQIMTREPESWLPRIKNAGAIFLGAHTPAVFGDYVAGPNHTLPTAGAARFASALSVRDFLRHQHIVQYDPGACRREGPVVEILAEFEELFNHALSVAIRYRDE